jgi:transposase-like protein
MPSTNSQPAARPTRRHFSIEQKLRILAAYEAAKTAEARGEVLRREGIYTSHIALWRQKRDNGGTAALDRKRGSKPNPEAREVERLRRERAVAQTQCAVREGRRNPGKMQALLHELGSKETAPASEPSPKKR